MNENLQDLQQIANVISEQTISQNFINNLIDSMPGCFITGAIRARRTNKH